VEFRDKWQGLAASEIHPLKPHDVDRRLLQIGSQAQEGELPPLLSLASLFPLRFFLGDRRFSS
jgi:hypothetical protein